MKQSDKSQLVAEFNSNSTAHLAIDLQEGCYRDKTRFRRAFDRSSALAQHFRWINLPNIFTRIAPHTPYKNAFPDPGEISLDRTASSAFDGTNLKKILQDKGITTLIISGVHYDLCVKETVRDALAAGFKVYLPLDCVNIYDDPPAQQKQTAKALYGPDVILTDSAELVALLPKI